MNSWRDSLINATLRVMKEMYVLEILGPQGSAELCSLILILIELEKDPVWPIM